MAAILPRTDDEALSDYLSEMMSAEVVRLKDFWPKFNCLTHIMISQAVKSVREPFEAGNFLLDWLKRISIIDANTTTALVVPVERYTEVFPDIDKTTIIIQPLQGVESLLIHTARRVRDVSTGELLLVG